MPERGILANLIVKLGLDSQEYDKELGKASGRLKGIGGDLTAVGTKLTAFGAAGAAAFGLAAKSAADFEKDLTNVTNLLGDAGKQFTDRFATGIRQVSAEFGTSKDVLTKGLFDIVSAGTDAADAIDVLSASAQLSVAGVASVDTATSALLTTLSAFGDQVTDAADASDFLFSVQKVGRTTLEEVASSFGKVAPLAAQAGLSLNDLGASLSTATLSGTSTAEVVTALQALLKTFIQPTDQAKDAAKALGVELNANALRGDNFIDTLQKISKGTIEQKTAIAGSVEAFRALGPIVQDVGKFQENYEAILNRQGATQKAANELQGTAAQQAARLRESLSNLSIQVGTVLLPALSDIVGEITPVVNSISEWAAENPRLTTTIVGVGAGLTGLALTLGPLALGLGQIATGFGSVGTLAAKLPGLLSGIGSASTSAALGVRGLAAAFAGPVGIIALLTAATFAYIKWGDAIKKRNDEVKASAEATRALGRDIIEAARAAGKTGVEIDHLRGRLERGRESTEEWNDRVNRLAKEFGVLKEETEETSVATKAASESMDAIAAASGKAAQGIKEESEALTLANAAMQVFRDEQREADAARAESTRISQQNAAAISEVEAKQRELTAQLRSTREEMTRQEAAARDLWRAFRDLADTAPIGSTFSSNVTAGLEALGSAALYARNEYGELTGEIVKIDTQADSAAGSLNQISTAISDLGSNIADIIVDGGKLTDVFESFGKTLIRILSENLLGQLIGQLGQLVKLIPGLSGFGSILSGTGGRAAGGAGGLAGLAGFGGPLGLAVSGGVLGGAVGGPLGAVLGAGGTAFGIGAAAGIAGGAGLGALSPIAALGPVGAAIFGGAAAVTGIAKLLSKSVAEKFSKEFARDFGNVRIPEGAVRQFIAGIGLDEKALEPIRKDIASSPLFLEIGFQAAQAQGRVEEFLRSLEGVGTVFGTGNFRAAFEFGQITGDFSLLNDAFVELFGSSSALVNTFGQELQPLLIDMGEDFEPLASRITAMTDAGANLETVFAKLAPEILTFISAADEVGLVLDPAIEQFREMAIATEGLTQRQLDLLSQLQTTRDFFPSILSQFDSEIAFLRDAGASTSEIFHLLGQDIESVVDAAEDLGYEIPQAVQDIYDLSQASEEAAEQMSAAALAGRVLGESLGLAGDAAVSFSTGFESVFDSVEDTTRLVDALTGEFAGLVTLMEGNGLDTLVAQQRAWDLLGDRIIEAYNDFLFLGIEIPPLLQQLIDLGILLGDVTVGWDGFADAVDNAVDALNRWPGQPDAPNPPRGRGPGGAPEPSEPSGPNLPDLDSVRATPSRNDPWVSFMELPQDVQREIIDLVGRDPGELARIRREADITYILRDLGLIGPLETARDLVPSFHSGGVMPWEGYAFLDKGETIIPPMEAGSLTMSLGRIRTAIDTAVPLWRSTAATVRGMDSVMAGVGREQEWGEKLDEISRNTRSLVPIERNTRDTADRIGRGGSGLARDLRTSIERNRDDVRGVISKVR